MKVSLTLSVDVDDELRRCIALEAGCLPDEIDAKKAETILAKRLLSNIDRVVGEIGFDKVPVAVIRRRVYQAIAEGHQKGTTPIIGASDKELCALLELPTNSVRWSRYWLQQNGLIYEAGRRSTGKFWRITDKAAPPEFNYDSTNTAPAQKICSSPTTETTERGSTKEIESIEELAGGGDCPCGANKCSPRQS